MKDEKISGKKLAIPMTKESELKPSNDGEILPIFDNPLYFTALHKAGFLIGGEVFPNGEINLYGVTETCQPYDVNKPFKQSSWVIQNRNLERYILYRTNLTKITWVESKSHLQSFKNKLKISEEKKTG